MSIEISHGRWVNEPKAYHLSESSIEIVTEPKTDLWQRTYYGFRNDNAPALLFREERDFTFTVKTDFDYQAQYDQCGVLIYIDSDNWFKASIEYETEDFARLGSVATNNGYSDWATRDIENRQRMWYRLSRRGPDFLIESSFDGADFEQMRIFHIHALGQTSPDKSSSAVKNPTGSPVPFGIYACSPGNSSFIARFSEIAIEPSVWLLES